MAKNSPKLMKDTIHGFKKLNEIKYEKYDYIHNQTGDSETKEKEKIIKAARRLLFRELTKNLQQHWNLRDTGIFPCAESISTKDWISSEYQCSFKNKENQQPCHPEQA